MIGIERYRQLKEFQQFYNSKDHGKSGVIVRNLEICGNNDEIMEILEEYVNNFLTSEHFSLDYIQELLLKLKLYRGIEIKTSTALTQMLVNLILNTILIPDYLKKGQYERNYQELKKIIDRQVNTFNAKIENFVGTYMVELGNIHEISNEIQDFIEEGVNTIRPRSFQICEGFGFNTFIYNTTAGAFEARIPINLDNKINAKKKKIDKDELVAYLNEIVNNYDIETRGSISNHGFTVDLHTYVDTDDTHNNGSGVNYLTLKISKTIDIVKHTTDFIPNLIEVLKLNNFVISSIIDEYGFNTTKTVRLFTNGGVLNFSKINESMQAQNVEMGAAALKKGTDFETCKMTDKNPVSLKDVGGQPKAKKQIEEILDRLKKEALYKKLGAKVEKGIIFEGPSGTGKTLLARVIASEIDGVAYHIKGSHIHTGSHLNEGLTNMKGLLKFLREKSKKSSKNIVVIFDEMETIFRKRGSSINASAEDEKIVNEFLSEQNGMDDLENILFIGTTNRRDLVDEAVFRRMGNEIKVDLPNHEGLVETYKIHIKKLPEDGRNLFTDIEIDTLATKSKGLSQAQVEMIVNKLVIKRAFEATSLEDIKKVSYEDIDSVINQVKKDNKNDEPSIGFGAKIK